MGGIWPCRLAVRGARFRRNLSGTEAGTGSRSSLPCRHRAGGTGFGQCLRRPAAVAAGNCRVYAGHCRRLGQPRHSHGFRRRLFSLQPAQAGSGTISNRPEAKSQSRKQLLQSGQRLCPEWRFRPRHCPLAAVSQAVSAGPARRRVADINRRSADAWNCPLTFDKHCVIISAVSLSNEEITYGRRRSE